MELWNFCRGCHLYSTGRPSCWASAHILVILGVKHNRLNICFCSFAGIALTRDVTFVFRQNRIFFSHFVSYFKSPSYCHVCDVFWKEVVQWSTPIMATRLFLLAVRGLRADGVGDIHQWFSAACIGARGKVGLCPWPTHGQWHFRPTLAGSRGWLVYCLAHLPGLFDRFARFSILLHVTNCRTLQQYCLEY